jgi:GDPmannose 4,6-dehydratase
MKTAFITGVSGQDGAYLASLLLDKGYKVIGLTRTYTSGTLSGLKYLGIENDVILEECDLLDFSSILKLLKKYQPEEVYNLSAQSSVGVSFEQPIGTISYNILSVLNILESIRLVNPLTRFYQASSSEIYGKAESLPITLDSPMRPVSPYAISKASAFWITSNYRESYNLYSVNGVLFNHESYLRSGNFFVKKVIRTALDIKRQKAKELKVGNLDIKRDFGFAPKYVEAMYLSLQQKEARDYIICSGQSVSLREVVYHVFDRLEISRDKIVEDKSLFRPNEINDLYGSNRDSIAQLNWSYDKNFFEILDVLIEEETKNLG